MTDHKKGKIIIFSAPSGGGKSTIIERMRNEFSNLYFSVSATTRAIRGIEQDNIDYFFLKLDEFEKKVENNEFVEHKKVYGNYYGTLKNVITNNIENGKNTIFDVDVKGALSIMVQYPEAVTIFIKPPNIEILEDRLRLRCTDSEEAIGKRLNEAKEELKYQNHFKFIIVNDELSQAVNQVRVILKDNGIV